MVGGGRTAGDVTGWVAHFPHSVCNAGERVWIVPEGKGREQGLLTWRVTNQSRVLEDTSIMFSDFYHLPAPNPRPEESIPLPGRLENEQK